jgi:riboflavin synthase alpha subunit
MFTGIIQAIGKVVKYDGSRLWVATPFRHIQLGESISIDGVCLTVAARKGSTVAFDVGKETQRVTTLRGHPKGSRLNLERALRVGDRLGGHWVSGHVEEMGHIRKIEKARANWWYTIDVPKAIRRFVVGKGSLTVDGISLTVVSMRRGHARIMIIPHTLTHTTLSDKKVGDAVNLEPDLLAKYALR